MIKLKNTLRKYTIKSLLFNNMIEFIMELKVDKKQNLKRCSVKNLEKDFLLHAWYQCFNNSLVKN